MSLRPNSLNEVIGNRNVLECLKISVTASKMQSKPLPHILLTGPSGTGKSTIAYVLANEMGSKFISANGSTLNSAKMILPYLAKLEHNTIWLIDEAHALKNRTQESLYTAMEDFFIDVGSPQKPVRMELPPFTLVVATTESGKLTEPLFNRFKTHYSLDYYSIDELTEILKQNRSKIRLSISDEGVKEVARRSKFTPRLANSHLEWMKDYAVAHCINSMSISDVKKAFSMRGIDGEGLTKQDRVYLNALKGNSPCGLETLESLTGLSSNTIANTIEPLLIRLGKVRKTSKGRVHADYDIWS